MSIPATTLESALAELTSQMPEVKRILLDNRGKLRQAHRIVLNDNLIQEPEATMALCSDDRVAFYTAVAGG
ncbi:MoaD/ThiS family protein [Rhodococcus sp. ARP2]|uniref:MoaD/ThiS family protein n=1 Tax=Rhodococcus sp. ARP2 TaxID=1661385 RepID=UPI001CB94F08